MTQSEVSGVSDPGQIRKPRAGHFRLGRLNEAAGVCGGRGSHGYWIDFEAWVMPCVRLLRSLAGW
jgi:hypothetical protein